MTSPDQHPRWHKQLQQNPNAVMSDVSFTVRLSLPEDADGTKHEKYPVVIEAIKDVWLYVSSVDGHLQHEVYADTEGKYHVVDPGEHKGKDTRPFMEGLGSVCDNVMLIAGSRLDKPKPNNFNPCCYYILPSPFQLPWQRFPHIEEAGKGGEFQNWATKTRNLVHVVLKDADTQEVLVEVPWSTAEVLNQAFLLAQGKWWAAAYEDPAALKRAQLRACVHTAEQFIDKGPVRRPLFKLIDLQDFHDEEEAFRKKLESLDDDLVHIRTRLVTQLKSPEMQILKQDALASPDPRALTICRGIWADVTTNLNAPGGDAEFLADFHKHNPGLFKKSINEASHDLSTWLEAHPELNPHPDPKWKRAETLKAVKLHWNLLKTFVAYVEQSRPGVLMTEFQAVGRTLFGVVPAKAGGGAQLKVHDAGGAEWDGRFTFKSSASIAKKIVSSPEFNEFIMVVDGYFLAKAYADYEKLPASQRDFKPVLATMSSFMNSTASVLATSLQKQEVKKLVGRSVAALVSGLDEAPIVVTPLSKLNFTEAWRRMRLLADTPKGIEVMGKAFGAVGTVFGIWSALNQKGEANARGDGTAAFGYGVVAGANFATGIGYFLGAGAIVWGALVGTMVGWPAVLALVGVSLVTGGSAISLLGSIMLPLLEHDPLEIWLKHCPWGLEKNKDSDNIDAQFTGFYRALAGLKMDCIFGILKDSFTLTVESRLAREPEEVWLGYTYVSEAGAFRRAFGPLTASECAAGKANVYELKVFSDAPKLVQAEVQIRPKDESIPYYPAKPEKPKPFTG